jgi:hypothetical protein
VLGTPSALPTGNAGGGSRTLQLLVVVLAGASALLAVAWYVLGVRRDRALLATLEDDEDEGDSPG